MWFVPVQVISIFLPIASHLSLLIYSLLFPQCSLSLSLSLTLTHTHTHTQPQRHLSRGPRLVLALLWAATAPHRGSPLGGDVSLGEHLLPVAAAHAWVAPPPIAASVSLDGCRRPLPLPPRAMCRVSYACHLHLSSSPLRRVPNLAML